MSRPLFPNSVAYRPDGEPWAYAPFALELLTTPAVRTGSAYPTRPIYKFSTDANGAFATDLTISTPETGAWLWRLWWPDRRYIDAYIEQGDGSAIEIDDWVTLAGLSGSSAGTPAAEWLNELYTAVSGAADGQLLETDGGNLAVSGASAANVPTTDEKAWVTAGKTAVADGADLVDANDLGTAAYASTVDFDAAGAAVAAVGVHNDDTNVHGVNTLLLETAAGAQEKADAAMSSGVVIAANGNLTLYDRIAALEAVVFVDLPTETVAVQDEFTDTTGVALTAHTPAPTNTPGNSWQHLAGTFDIQSNKASCASKPGSYAVATIDSALSDCIVQTTVTYIGVNTGIVLRCLNSTSYIVFILGVNCYIIKRDGGLSILAGPVVFSPSVGADYTITATLNGSSIEINVNDGAVIMTATSSFNSTVTKHGLYCESIGRTWNDFVVKALAEYATLTAGAKSFYNTLQNNVRSGYIETSFLASWIVYTDASELIVSTYSNHASDTDWMRVAYRVDDGSLAVLTPSATGAAQFTISLGSGSKHKVEFLSGLQSKPGSFLGAWPVSVQPTGGTYCVDGTPTSQFTSSMVIYGDSITVGDGATISVAQGYATLLRDALPENPVVCEAWGYRSLYDDANTAGLIDTLVAKIAAINPAIIWLSIGTNDYGLNRWSAASFGAGYEALLVDLVTALPSALIYCMTPLHRTTETANGSGSTLQDYRDAIEAAVTAAGNSNVTFVDSSDWLTNAELADGVHPNTAGHAIVAARIIATLKG